VQARKSSGNHGAGAGSSVPPVIVVVPTEQPKPTMPTPTLPTTPVIPTVPVIPTIPVVPTKPTTT
jgi:hypothetical protein